MAGRSGLRVFYDSFSQPSRAVLLLLHANNVKFEPRMIKIGKGRRESLLTTPPRLSFVSLLSQVRIG